ncbi:sortase [Plantactinospora sp. KLBMP9567]|uniref:sortase n=1 Tax=Plantactinospora sp. KLBMP9567 TaxID=3085900 RepID=UPI002980E9BA|nr:sortase [Plantactinospora sp. KLBMP9567]MDW5322230.1 sortase [Plantactinospora sp. KLBMP9567]MDW5324458.1 sortase [Plantactinospora sp. KLBMP9567]
MTATVDPPTVPPVGRHQGPPAAPPRPAPAPAAGGAPASPVGPPTRATPTRASRSVEIPAVRVTGTVLTLLGVLLLAFVVHLTLISQLRYERAQQTAYADFRKDLAEGVAPVGQTDLDGELLRPGTSVAVLRIPVLGTRQVVFEGTTGAVLQNGPGHRRDTVLPGQPGTSVVLGRHAGYGGPFAGLSLLTPGDEIVVVTGQGEHRYQVTGLRRPGDPLPPRLADGAGRLTLATADGRPYLPDNVLYADADLVSPAQPSPQRRFGAQSLTAAEQAMAGDPAAWVPLVLWGQALLIAAYAVSWAWARWGGWQAWVSGMPPLAVLGLTVADQAVRLLPNLY